jgi:protein-tyrosine kinase
METTQNILLVDANLTNPVVHDIFGLDYDYPGLTDYLVDDKPLKDLFLYQGVDRFVTLPRGRTLFNSTVLLT